MARTGRPKKVRTSATKTLVVREVTLSSCDMLKAYAFYAHKTMGQVLDEVIADSPKLQQFLEANGGMDVVLQHAQQARHVIPRTKRGQPKRRDAIRTDSGQPLLRMVGSTADAHPHGELSHVRSTSGLAESASSKPLLVTINRAASLMSLGRTHVHMLVLSGELKSIKIGRSRRIVVSSIEAFIQRLLANDA